MSDLPATVISMAYEHVTETVASLRPDPYRHGANAGPARGRELRFLAVGHLPLITGWFPQLPDGVPSWC